MQADWQFEVPSKELRYAQSHVVVRFNPGERARAAAAGNEFSNLLARLDLPPGAELVRTAGEIAELAHAKSQPRFSTGFETSALDGSLMSLADSPPAGETPRLSMAPLPSAATGDPDRHLYLRLPPTLTVTDCVRRLSGHPAVDYVEPDAVVRAALVTPNDPAYQQQWYHLNSRSNGTIRADIHTPEAWEITRGSSNVIVGMLDTGINAALPDFAGRIVPGYNFANNNTNTADDNFHGTAIASIVAATGNNSNAIAGIDWHCKLMPIKVLNQGGGGVASWYADGLDWARTHGCKIVNLAFASEMPSETVTRAISNAIAAGVIVVALADNGGFPAVTFPGTLTNVITVGSSDRFDRWAVSNYGPEVDLVAPGVEIAFLYLDGSVTSASGNSASAPMISGAAALLASIRPDLTHEMAQTLLCAGAEDNLGDFRDTPGYDPYYGWGRLNAYHSLILARTRIHELTINTNHQVELSWECPPNAASKKPYRIEVADDLAGPWVRLAAWTNIVYQAQTASWVDTSPASLHESAAPRFYRLKVVVE